MQGHVRGLVRLFVHPTGGQFVCSSCSFPRYDSSTFFATTFNDGSVDDIDWAHSQIHSDKNDDSKNDNDNIDDNDDIYNHNVSVKEEFDNCSDDDDGDFKDIVDDKLRW